MAKTRLKILMWLTALPALLIFAKLWSLQLDPVKHQHFRVRAENSSLISIPPVRGAIYDRNGEVLAENQSGFDLHFVYSELNPRYIVFEVVCEELGRLGGFPKVAEARALLRQLVDIDRLEALLSQGKPFEPEWLRVVDRIPPEVAERITRRLSPRKIFQDNFELRPASAAGEQDHFELWLRPEKLFRLELTLRRLAARIDEYSLEDLEGRLDAGLEKIDALVARDVRRDIESGADELFIRKKTKNSRRLHYRMDRLLAPGIDLQAVSMIEYHPGLYPGIRIVDSTRRIYPRGEVFGPLTGYLRKLNREDLHRLEKDGRLLDHYSGVRSAEAFSVIRRGALRHADSVGQGGIEGKYDALLRGEYGMRLQQKGKRSGQRKLLTSLSSSNGTDINTTIDGNLQELLYRQLWAECAHHGHAAASAAVMELPSGALLASAAYPSFDPNKIRNPAYRDQMNKDLGDQTPDWLLDRPRSKALYPGSIFKIITAIAALEDGRDWEGVVDPLRKFECLVGEHKPFTMRCSSRLGHGPLNLYEAFQASCNNYFYYLSTKHLDSDTFDRWSRKLGCGALTGVDLPALRGAYDRGFLEKPQAIAGERGLCMYGIGQRQVQMTPLQALRMVGAVALGLRKVPSPWLVKKVPPQDISIRNPRTAAILQECMKRVVSDRNGTVYGKLGLENYNFAAKTGTAQYHAGTLRYHSWLVGYGPLPNPTMAFVIVCEKSRLGGGDAGSPVARVLMDYLAESDSRYLAQPPQELPPSQEGGGGL